MKLSFDTEELGGLFKAARPVMQPLLSNINAENLVKRLTIVVARLTATPDLIDACESAVNAYTEESILQAIRKCQAAISKANAAG